tara:strand:+ start:617 stop:754 length:138 start_codon:yes stop_codon:yes gene_type:complete
MKEKTIQLEFEYEYDIDEMIEEQKEEDGADTEIQKPFDEDMVQSI